MFYAMTHFKSGSGSVYSSLLSSLRPHENIITSKNKTKKRVRSRKCLHLATRLYGFEYWTRTGFICCWFFFLNDFFIYFHFCGMFWSLSPHMGDLLPKGNLSVEHRVPVLNVLHLVALKHEFAWLSLAVCEISFDSPCVVAAPGSSVFGLLWLSMLV